MFYLSIPHSKSIIKRLNRPPPVFVGIETYWSSSQCREDIQDEILREREREREREMGRAPCCDKANVKKGPWSPEEDSKLKEYIEKYGTGGNWIALPQKAGKITTNN